MTKEKIQKHKSDILNKICYTDLVYNRINKKLNLDLSNEDIEKMILNILEETEEAQFQKSGKNIYIINDAWNIRITINSNTYRIITVDELVKLKKKNNNLIVF